MRMTEKRKAKNETSFGLFLLKTLPQLVVPNPPIWAENYEETVAWETGRKLAPIQPKKKTLAGCQTLWSWTMFKNKRKTKCLEDFEENKNWERGNELKKREKEEQKVDIQPRLAPKTWNGQLGDHIYEGACFSVCCVVHEVNYVS